MRDLMPADRKQHRGKKVSVIIFNYNGMAFLDRCIKCVLSQDYKDYELFLLDNGSTDGSADFVRKKYPEISLLRIEKNNGIAEAQDFAYRSMKTPYIISLHNDAFARPGWLSGLVNAMDRADKSVAAIEGGIMQADGKSLAGMLNFMFTNSLVKCGTEIIYPATCSMIFRNHILDRYGDPDYYFCSDDVYFGLLFRLMGYKIMRTDESWVDHLGSKSETTTKISKRYQFFNERNRWLVFLTFLETGTIIKLLPLNIFYTAATIVGLSFGKKKWKVMPWLSAYFWLLTHPVTIARKRKLVQSYRSVPDSKIFPFISCVLPRFLGSISRVYCRFARINCMEFAKKKQ